MGTGDYPNIGYVPVIEHEPQFLSKKVLLTHAYDINCLNSPRHVDFSCQPRMTPTESIVTSDNLTISAVTRTYLKCLDPQHQCSYTLLNQGPKFNHQKTCGPHIYRQIYI
jgi:hypothetical protein